MNSTELVKKRKERGYAIAYNITVLISAIYELRIEPKL
jgi:hypothetical protein